jgi:hypothetical protein
MADGVNPYIPQSAGQNLLGVHFPAARVNAVYEWAQAAVEDPTQRAEILREELDAARKTLVKMQDTFRTRVNTAEGGISDKDRLNAQLRLRDQDLGVGKANAANRLRAQEMANDAYRPPASLGRVGPELVDTLRKTQSIDALNRPDVLNSQIQRVLGEANLRSGGALMSASDSQRRAVGVEVLQSLGELGLSPDTVLEAEAQVEQLLGVQPESLNPEVFNADKAQFVSQAMSASQASGRTKVDAVLDEALLKRQGEAKYVGGQQAEGVLTPEEEILRDKYVAALSDTDTPGDASMSEFASPEEFAQAKAIYDKARGTGAYSRAQRQFFDPGYLGAIKDVAGLEKKVALAEAGKALTPQEKEMEVARLFRQRAALIPGVRVSVEDEAPDATLFQAAGAVNPIFAEIGPIVMQNLRTTEGGRTLRTPDASRKDPVSLAQRRAAEMFAQDPKQTPQQALSLMRALQVPEEAIRAGLVHYMTLKLVDSSKATTLDFQGVPGTAAATPKPPAPNVMGPAKPGSDLARRDAILNPVLFRDEALAANKAKQDENREIQRMKKEALAAETKGITQQDRFERRDLRQSLETPEGVFVRKFRERATLPEPDATPVPGPTAAAAGRPAPARPLTDEEMEAAIQAEMLRQRRLGL